MLYKCIWNFIQIGNAELQFTFEQSTIGLHPKVRVKQISLVSGNNLNIYHVEKQKRKKNKRSDGNKRKKKPGNKHEEVKKQNQNQSNQ